MRTTDLLDQVKARHGLTSDYQLAKLMGWTTQAVSNYRNRGRSLGDAAALQVATALQVDAGYVLAVAAAERAQSAAARSAWERAAARLCGALAAALLLWVAGGTLPGSEALAGSVGPLATIIM
jgi:transcriptional regulator with XRE-family HTH domain